MAAAMTCGRGQGLWLWAWLLAVALVCGFGLGFSRGPCFLFWLWPETMAMAFGHSLGLWLRLRLWPLRVAVGQGPWVFALELWVVASGSWLSKQAFYPTRSTPDGSADSSTHLSMHSSVRSLKPFIHPLLSFIRSLNSSNLQKLHPCIHLPIQ